MLLEKTNAQVCGFGVGVGVRVEGVCVRIYIFSQSGMLQHEIHSAVSVTSSTRNTIFSLCVFL